jgi:hypothetical protein
VANVKGFEREPDDDQGAARGVVLKEVFQLVCKAE